MQGQLLDHPVLQEIAEKYGKSAAQVILRWDLQNTEVFVQIINSFHIVS
jgi:diketogulonate reductase-like aldo/keto reductase